MTSVRQVELWVDQGESELIELKRGTAERRSGAQTLCGMLNNRGGRVLFGVEPSGKIVGQMVSDRTSEDLAQELSEIDPPVFPSIDRVPVAEDRYVFVVSVTQGSNRPYSFRGVAYWRMGNTTRKLSREEYHRLLLERLHGEKRWENEPATAWNLSDLETGEIIRTLEEAIRRGRADDPGVRDPAEILRGLGLMRDGQLLRAAPVLFGRVELLESLLPQCLLRVARFRGSDGRGTIKMEELTTRAGLPRPEIIESSGCVMVRFAPSRYVPPQRTVQDVTERQQRILEILSSAPSGMAVRDVVPLLKGLATLRQVRLELSALRVLGLVFAEGHGKGARWRLH